MALHQESTAEADVFIPETINLSKQPTPQKSSGCC